MTFLQSLIDGIGLGAVYAVVAVGIGLVFGVMRLVNFAYGELITAGGYTLALLSGAPAIVAIIVCFAVVVTLALIQERIAFRPLRGASPATMLIATFAVSFLLQNVYLLIFGSRGSTVGTLGQLNEAIAIGSLRIRYITIVAAVVGAALLAGLTFVLNRTMIGLQLRAAAADLRTARTLGVRADRVITAAFAISGVLAAAVAILLTVQSPLVTPDYGVSVTIFALVGVVVGGLDRLVTAALGGFAIGFANAFVGDLLPSSGSAYLPSVVYGLVILILVVRPSGLFASRRATAAERV
ncbi:MAG TPA: branched-chain amino acid ABC transporter permease [Solirubrobacteraceae bacterium]|jgi:branched-chain amino acid transport system permease protein|nr:branched-chain amino acid ABC transporter permease [Solirubrobacteraceae bacterium]